MACVGNVLLLLAVGIVIGVSMKVSVMLVKSVPNYSLRKVILMNTSRVCTRVRNHTTVLNVVKTSHIGVILIATSRVSIRVRNRTTVLAVVKTSQIGVILDGTTGVSTRQSESALTASSEKNKPVV